MTTKQTDLGFPESSKEKAGPVECLGLTFENDDARRAHFVELLREKLQDPAFRDVAGFPNGSDDDILRLSDPPYYTACPNPFLDALVADWNSGREQRRAEQYDREPFCSDVTQGKGGRLYKAHTYHTKVPPEAIAKFILHYTDPGDVVLDGFAGSGMTGLGAALCAYPSAKLQQSVAGAKWGPRRAVLVDLSPFATFLSYGANSTVSADEFESQARSLIEGVRAELGAETYGVPPAAYVLWSQIFLCPACSKEISFLDVAITDSGSISSKFSCPWCRVDTSKARCERKVSTAFDPLLGRPIKQNEYRPFKVMRLKGATLEDLTESDLDSIAADWGRRASGTPVTPMVSTVPEGEKWGSMYRAGYHAGVSHVHHFWTPRNLAVLATLWRRAELMPHPNQMRLALTSFMVKTGSRMHNVGLKGGKINLAGQIFNTLQIPSVFAERNLFELALGKISDLRAYFEQQKPERSCAISTGTAERIGLSADSVDYMFVDPPFGSNIMYSEMSFLYEAWLRVTTAKDEEAIVSSGDGKTLEWYRARMVACFREFHRVLKPGRWVTIAFHNSRNDVWNALQEALRRAGLVIADVRVLDKGQGTFKQMTTTGAVEKDLAISAYKPSETLEQATALAESSEESCWLFVKEHLSRLPVAVVENSAIEVLQERTPQLLFDRMVAFHVVRGIRLPVSASEFYAGIAHRFPERDGMYFATDQVAEYDRKRTSVSALRQLSLFVNDEASAVQWVRQQLQDRPQSFQDLQPQFLRELNAWASHEATVELKVILDQGFLYYDGRGLVPSQIHRYLSSNFKDLRSLEKADPRLVEKARDRWYVPDPKKQADLEQLRDRALLKEFEDYKASSQRKLKIFRTEAMRAGFKACWQRRDYGTIVTVAERLPDAVLHEDEKLLMYYDNALTRLGDE